MKKAGSSIGAVAALCSITLWIIFVFFNPYAAVSESEVVLTTFFMLMVPAALSLTAAALQKSWYMFLAFVWSLLPSVYLAMTPGIFAWFGIICIGYLISFILMILGTKRHKTAPSA